MRLFDVLTTFQLPISYLTQVITAFLAATTATFIAYYFWRKRPPSYAPLRVASQEALSVLQGFYEHTPILLGVVELVGEGIKHVYDNPAGSKFWGESIGGEAGCTQGRFDSELRVDPATTAAWLGHYRSSIETRAPVRFTWRSPDTRWYSVTVCPVVKEPHYTQQFCYLAEDVTEAKESETALREAHELNQKRLAELSAFVTRLQQAELAGRIGIAEWDMTTNTLTWSEQLEQLYGITHGTFGGKLDDWLRLIDPRDLLTVREALDKAPTSSLPSVELQYRIRQGSGVVRWLSYRGTLEYNQEHRPVRCLSTEVDITAWKESEERARLDRERLELALEAGQLGFWDWDIPSGHVLYGGRWAAMLGYSAGEILPHIDSWRSLAHPGDLICVEEVLHEHFELKRAIYEVELRLKMKDGAWRWILSRGRVVERSEDNKPIRMVGVHVDIHEQRQIRDQLKEADRRKDEFIATLAHELRNPLAPIRTGLQIIKRDPAGPMAQTARDMMDRQLAHLVRLIDDILDVSRITLGRLELKKEPVTIGTIIDTAIEGSRPFIESEKHTLTVTNPDPELLIFGDLTRLAQVVSNLLNNSAKYTPEGGSIDLYVEHTKSEIIIRVHDTGLGIPSELLDKIFEMFSQVNKTLDRAQGGVGIGLALVRRLVELHGGSVVAESPGIGKGSTFTVTLPRAPEIREAHVTTQATPTQLPTTSSRRILIVDDNIDGAESLAMYMRMLGHTPTVVHTGKDALSEIDRVKPEVVFLDIGLPEMDGYEVARRIRDMAAGKNVHLVALTGWGGAEDKRRTKEAGFDEHLTKPAELSVVERILDTLPTLGGA